jgi:hypothetical protein
MAYVIGAGAIVVWVTLGVLGAGFCLGHDRKEYQLLFNKDRSKKAFKAQLLCGVILGPIYLLSIYITTNHFKHPISYSFKPTTEALQFERIQKEWNEYQDIRD